jgi:hypothetical protein
VFLSLASMTTCDKEIHSDIESLALEWSDQSTSTLGPAPKPKAHYAARTADLFVLTASHQVKRQLSTVARRMFAVGGTIKTAIPLERKGHKVIDSPWIVKLCRITKSFKPQNYLKILQMENDLQGCGLKEVEFALGSRGV